MSEDLCEISTAADALGAARRVEERLETLPLSVRRDHKSIIDQCLKHLRSGNIFSEHALHDFQTLSLAFQPIIDWEQGWGYVEGSEHEAWIQSPKGEAVSRAQFALNRMRLAAERTLDVINATRVISCMS